MFGPNNWKFSLFCSMIFEPTLFYERYYASLLTENYIHNFITLAIWNLSTYLSLPTQIGSYERALMPRHTWVLVGEMYNVWNISAGRVGLWAEVAFSFLSSTSLAHNPGDLQSSKTPGCISGHKSWWIVGANQRCSSPPEDFEKLGNMAVEKDKKIKNKRDENKIASNSGKVISVVLYLSGFEPTPWPPYVCINPLQSLWGYASGCARSWARKWKFSGV